jgi:hypothetical protein
LYYFYELKLTSHQAVSDKFLGVEIL